ncbi:MAG: hypothetical protein DME18_13015 [Verrucomicrobia bacterium]|nr:MAG: hypothetical protein DME19_16325 [Verrucomicrobiota bacterium]PYM11795.1 MAG: hypothetical protein DME18_13015 [Verrucomicrobiota bacterium]
MNTHHLELFYYVARHGGISEAVAGIEVDSLDLIETYVSNGFGIGLSVAVPKAKTSSHIRVLKLDDFAPVVVGVLWRGRLTALTEAFLGEFRKRAQQLLT